MMHSVEWRTNLVTCFEHGTHEWCSYIEHNRYITFCKIKVNTFKHSKLGSLHLLGVNGAHEYDALLVNIYTEYGICIPSLDSGCISYVDRPLGTPCCCLLS